MRAMLISSLGLMLLVVGVSYSFFNYTRTGAENNLRTGRIYFNTTEGTALNITSAFPMTSTEAGNANLDSVTVGIVGDTTYADGEEFVITLVDVNNTVNGKQVPVTFIATYAPATGGTIGSSSSTYFTSRDSKDSTIYKLNATGQVEEGKQVLVGYIDNGATGISGTLTIKAYVDADKVAISDTYPNGERYAITSNLTSTQLSNCLSFFSDLDATEAFCRGTGTVIGPMGTPVTLQQALDNGYFTSSDIEYLLGQGIIYVSEEYGTTDEWVDNRVVLTTTEWNSLASNPISFKIKAESNEGIWTSPQIDSCVGCKFLYYVMDPQDPSTPLFTTWNYGGTSGGYPVPVTPSVITTGLYDNYLDLVNTVGKNYFLGVKLNSSNQATNAYACGVKDNIPFCVEGSLYPNLGGNQTPLLYASNVALLQSSNLYNNTCVTQTVNLSPTEQGEGTSCSSTSISAAVGDFGEVSTISGNNVCGVAGFGAFGCVENAQGG